MENILKNKMKIWVISDTHWNHANIIQYENRPQDHKEQIIANWNKVVQPEDLVIHLGDVIMGLNAAENLPSIMATLPGKKILCRGNHDHEKQWGTNVGFMERGFDVVVDYFVYENLAFSHAPLTPLPSQGSLGWRKEVDFNIHGHFHRGIHRGNYEEKDDRYYNWNYYKDHKDKYKLVQIEDELRPFSLEEILK